MPARPSDKSMLAVKYKVLGSEDGTVIGRGLFECAVAERH
jgi:hypothetical protein